MVTKDVLMTTGLKVPILKGVRVRAIRLYFKSYTRYSWVADEEQKKKVLGVFYGSFLVVLLKGAMDFLISLKGAIWIKFYKILV